MIEAPAKPELIAPHTFAVGVLHQKPYLWQAAIMRDVWRWRRTAARCCNGSGKTDRVVTPLSLDTLAQFKRPTVVIVSATHRQVRDQVFASIKKHEPRFPSWDWADSRIESPTGGRIIGFSTDNGGRFEGFHSDGPDAPLLIIADEAKTIADDIFVAIDRCNPDMLLYISSPGGVLGRFHDSFKLPGYAKHVVGVDQCPHITQEFIQQMGELYGTDSEIYRSMILGEFAAGNDDGTVIPFGALEACLRCPPMEHSTEEPVGFCDFAESSDENVLVVVRGNRVEIADAWVQPRKADGQPDKDAVVSRFKALFRSQGLKPERIWGDASGMGYGYAYALRKDGWAINTCENSDKPDDDHYFNLGAEMWWEARYDIEAARRILPRDEVMKRQLCTRKKEPREDGKLQLQPKKRIQGPSPDRADAVVGALYWSTRANRIAKAIGHMGGGYVPQNRLIDAQQEMEGAGCGIPGAWAG